MRITKRQLRRFIREQAGPQVSATPTSSEDRVRTLFTGKWLETAKNAVADSIMLDDWESAPGDEAKLEEMLTQAVVNWYVWRDETMGRYK